MLAVRYTHIAIANNMLSMDLVNKVINVIQRTTQNSSHVATVQNVMVQVETTAQQSMPLFTHFHRRLDTGMEVQEV